STDYFVYDQIPVKPSTRYKCYGGNRTWFLDENREPISTLNIISDTDEQWCFTTPVNAKYASITFRVGNLNKPEEATLIQLDHFEDVTPCPLEADPGNPDCYFIDDVEDIIWLGDREHSERLGEGKTFFLTTDLDFRLNRLVKSVKLPSNSAFNGNNHTIKGLKTANGFLGSTSNLTIRDLTISGATITGTDKAHIGILADTLTGNTSISNVTIENSSVTSVEGAAGGLVGYISRNAKNNRAEQMQVTIDNCHIINTSIEANGHEGYFIGRLSGYDNAEVLIFNDNCSVSPKGDALNSAYIEGNEAIWLADTDYSEYNAWLGDEEYYRGTVIYGNDRFIPKWDGKTYVKPLLADPAFDDTEGSKVAAGEHRYMIYSAFDLVGVREYYTNSPRALYFREDVDLFGQGKDGVYKVPDEFPSRCSSQDDNYFKVFSTVDYIDGDNHTIYNMRIAPSIAVSTSFIRGIREDTHTVHKNLNLVGCQTDVRVLETSAGDSQNQDSSVASIFISYPNNPGATYEMENIHAYECRVFGIQACGILCSHFSGTMKNCSVNNSYIENYQCKNNLEMFSEIVSIGGGNVTVSAGFYSYGEIGGLCGMVQGNTSITDCHVRGTTINAYGEDDKEAEITGEGALGQLAAATATGLGYYLVPGRHVSTLIGDIRTTDGETITITGCSADKDCVCSPKQHKHSSSVPYIGQAYYVKFLDTQGKVIVDGRQLTLADCNVNTVRQ
ncbi:MAG: hypothetical protein J6S01_09975, partial [Bacteroidales bacterium]|nr:hypothetical protein [Bacteroidales bacterium]